MSRFSDLTGWHVVLAAGMGLVEAFLILTGYRQFALALALAAPAVVLFFKYPLGAMIVWMIATPFLQSTITDQGREAYWVVYRALPPIGVAYSILSNRLHIQKARLQLRLKTDSLVMIVFLAWSVLNILWYHPSGFVTHFYLLYDQFFVPFCLFWWLRFSAPKEQDLNKWIPIALALVLFEVFVGVAAWLRPGILPREWVGFTRERTIGTLGAVHAYSLTVMFHTFLLFQAGMNHKSKFRRFILLGAVGTGIMGVFLSFSRGAWLGGITACFGLLILYPKIVSRLAIALVIIALILGNTVLYQQMKFADDRLQSEQSAMVRFVIWDAGIQMIEQKPLWGWGFGDYRVYAGKFQREVFNIIATKEQASHNTFISIAAELGIPGLLLFLFPGAWLLRRTIKRRKSLVPTGFWSMKLVAVLWLFILAYFITIFFSDIRTSTYGLGLFWVALGWIATLVDPNRTEILRSR